ncbi:ABC transporter ATP-binding protein [uncultured Ruminococcus sp.]|uniref:ABC transporter ATP-binding protein n=1 Tax=uncultured Ruminococcus sp. TaxID=165186 RepID=UPI00292E1910|nr:ABC transporter ATP-binding protein [uncultured Ruminococcus sp.]
MLTEIRNIKKSYGKNHVLNGITFSVEAGRCVAILGKNGCGKSTLLSILAGVQRCDSGELLIDGHPLFSRPAELRRNIGYVPQGTPLIEELSARDNLLLWYAKAEIERELNEGVLDLLGIGDFLKTPVSKMSGGMKKRLSIGCAMQTRPPVLLLDEPCAALDIECKERILRYLSDYKSRGGTLVLISHDPMELSICDEYKIMRGGILHDYAYDGDVARLVQAL